MSHLFSTKKIFTFIFVLYSLICSAQNETPILRIISFSGSVTLNGSPVSVDQKILSSPDAVIEVPGGLDYVGVLTHEGYAGRLIGGKYPVKDISRIIYNRKYAATGAVNRNLEKIRWMGMIEKDKTLSDKIHLRWEPQDKLPYKLFVKNRFDDTLLDTAVSENEITLNVGRFLKSYNDGVILEVSSGRKLSEPRTVSPASTDLKRTVASEIANIPSAHPHRNIMIMAILDLNELYFDLIGDLNTTKATDISDLPEDFKNYVVLITKRINTPDGY